MQDVREQHAKSLEPLVGDERANRLCELNVMEQVVNLGRTTIVREAWARGQPLTLHGWIYALRDGLLRDLDATVASHAELEEFTRRLRG